MQIKEGWSRGSRGRGVVDDNLSTLPITPLVSVKLYTLLNR